MGAKQRREQAERDKDEIANLRLEEKKLDKITSRLKIAEKEATKQKNTLNETKEELKKSKERNAELEKRGEENNETAEVEENEESPNPPDKDQETKDPKEEIKKLNLTIKKRDRTILDLQAQIRQAVDDNLQKDRTIRNLNNNMDTLMKVSGETT